MASLRVPAMVRRFALLSAALVSPALGATLELDGPGATDLVDVLCRSFRLSAQTPPAGGGGSGGGGGNTFTVTLTRSVDAQSSVLERALLLHHTWPVLTLTYTPDVGSPSVLTLAGATLDDRKVNDDQQGHGVETLTLSATDYVWTVAP